MATGITIEIKADTTGFRRDVKSALDAGGAQVRQFKSAIDSSVGSVNSLRSALGGLKTAFAAIGGALVLKQIAETAIQSAISIDKTRQTIAALTGGVDAANKKIAELRKLAESPGVTTSFAADLFAQFKALKTVADTTINDLIKSIGRLNAVFAIPDVKTFSRNLIQIFQGGFERDQIKEALQAVPIFDQLLQSAFGTSDGQKLKKLKDAGKLTMDTFLAGLIEQINARFPNVQDSLGSQFEKLRDRLNFALEPVGKALVGSLIPIFDDLVKSVEKYGSRAAEVFRDNRSEIVQTAREIGALVIQIGKLAGAVFNLGINGKTGLSGLKQEFRDALSIVAFMTDIAEGNIVSRPRTLEVEAAHRREGFAEGNIRGPLSRDEIRARIQRENQGAGGGGGNAAGGSGSAGTSEAASEARALRDAQLAFVKEQAENELKIVKDVNDRGLRDLRDLYDKSKITVREFYEFKQNLAVDTLDKELAVLDREEAAIRKSLASATGAERIRDEAKLNDVLAQQALKRKEILDTVIQTGREFKKTAELSPITAQPVQVIDRDAEARELRVTQSRLQQFKFNLADLDLRRQELQIQNAVNRGALTEAEGREAILATQRQFRDVMLESLRAQEQLTVDPERLGQIRIQIEQIQLLGVEFSNAQRFARGFGSQIETVGDAFERFGANVSRALTSTKDLLDNLKQAVLQFFNDLLGRSLQNVVKSVLGPIFGSGGGAGSGGGGIGSIFGNIFRTPSTFPTGGGGGNAFQSVANAFSGAAGSGLTAPPSITSGLNFFSSSSGPSPFTESGAFVNVRNPFASGAGTAVGAAATASKFSFKGLGQNLAAAAPLLGLSIGSSLGGQSVAGQILGAGGGLLTGGFIGASLAPGAFSPGVAAFFTNPITAIVGGALLVGAVFLGRAKQRRKDEEASGEMLGQALNSISQLKAGISSDQIAGAQARPIFDQILNTFKQQIGGLKTASVRKSRLTNQVRDLENIYQREVVPLIEAQAERQRIAERNAFIDKRLVPQFAAGGTVPGIDRGHDSVMAMLRPGEMVLTRGQQASVMAQSNPGVFERAGVPRAGIPIGPAQAFQFGGTAQTAIFAPPGGGQSGGQQSISLYVSLGMTRKDSQQVVAQALDDRTGQNIIVNVLDKVQTRSGRG